MQLNVNGCNTDFIVDTGSDVTVLNDSTYQKLNLQLLNSTQHLVGADGGALKVEGQ